MATSERPPPRRWLRRLGLGLAAFAALVLAVFAWAWHSTDSSTLARALVWMEADIGDQGRFPARSIPTSARPSRLRQLPRSDPSMGTPGGGGDSVLLDQALDDTDTRAFVVVARDRVVYQRYDDGSGPGSLETSFSVAKSFVSTLIGIAIDDGEIGSVADPVTEYVPELADRDPRFTRITLADLLTMTSGLRYEEASFPFPWGDDTYTYYGTDLRSEALDRTEVDTPPGESWHYNNYNPLLLGLVLERATGESVSEYASRRLWRPLGAASDASWSLDSDESGFEKLESGFNATALDYARFGLLFLDDGRWNGRRIVADRWVRAATAGRVDTDYANDYGYSWWVDGTDPQRFYALGNYGQYIYVAPDAGVVIVRLGSDWGRGNEAWLAMFRDLADELGGR